MSSENLKAPLSPEKRIKIGAVVVYLLTAFLSLAWGSSYDLFYEVGLRADIGVGQTGEGSTFVTVANNGPIAWTNVRVLVDGQWFVRVDSLPPGAQTDARLREFENAFRLPRPPNVFFWEQVGPEPEPSFAVPNYRPSTVEVRCDQGAVEASVSF
ncbi:MAG: hypothetical protein ACJAYU_004050 [Bradymonadia bacterium]